MKLINRRWFRRDINTCLDRPTDRTRLMFRSGVLPTEPISPTTQSIYLNYPYIERLAMFRYDAHIPEAKSTNHPNRDSPLYPLSPQCSI